MQIVIDVRVVSFLVLLLLSAFFSASETALMALNMIKVKQLVKQKKRGAQALYRVKQNPHRLLSTVLIGNNLVNVAAAALVTAIAIEAFGSAGIGIATGVMTFLILVFGEITPKSYAVSNAEKIAVVVARPFELLSWALSPLIWLLDILTTSMMRLFGAPAHSSETLTEEEIRSIVTIGAEEGAIKEQEREMIYKIFKFDDVPVSDIMIPKPDVDMVEAKTPLKDVFKGKGLQDMMEHSRFPVYEGSRDNIAGIFYYKTALRHLQKGDRKTVGDVAMPALFVPETMKIDALFSEFKRKRTHLAVVVNEHGIMQGVVTLEDVLEEIVGEIRDETDEADDSIRKVKDGYLVEGTTRLDELNEEIGVHFDDSEADTIGGYIAAQLGKMPEVGDELSEDGLSIVVVKASKRRVKRVRITKGKRAVR